MRIWVILLLSLCCCASAQAQTVDPERLDQLSQQQQAEIAREAELKKSRAAVQSDIKALKTNLTKAAEKANVYEREGRTIEKRLADLLRQETDLKSKIFGDRKTLMQLLAALQRIEANPPPALAVTPGDAADAARAARLMTSVSADLRARSELLTQQLADLNDVHTQIQSEQAKLATNEKELEKQRAVLKTNVERKAKLEASLSADQKAARDRVNALAAEADTLRDLIRQFESAASGVIPRIKPKPGETPQKTTKPRRSSPSKPLTLPKGTKPFAQAKNLLRAPVKGRIAKAYTSSRKGMTISTRDKAAIVAPYAGRVEFAGAFKNYDNVVILNVGDGYFILLTGLGETYVSSGEMVNLGEPLGLMPFNTKSGPELYIEFRKNGTTINPTPWLGTAFAS